MPDSPPDKSIDASMSDDLSERVAAIGRRLGEREASHQIDLAHARDCVAGVRTRVEGALESFHRAAAEAGAPHLRVELGELKTDDKHLRAVEFDLCRGRHRAIVTAKSRGDVTLVGPFHRGKAEGPCRSFPLDSGDELSAALVDFMEQFLEAAASP